MRRVSWIFGIIGIIGVVVGFIANPDYDSNFDNILNWIVYPSVLISISSHFLGRNLHG